MDLMEEEYPSELEIPMNIENNVSSNREYMSISPPKKSNKTIAPETISFRFNSRDETLRIVNTGGDLVEYLTNNQEACPLLGKEITFINVLGKGNAGAPAWLISIPGGDRKEYVAKVFEFNIELPRTVKDGTLGEIASFYQEKFLIPMKTLIAMNGGNPNIYYPKGSIVAVPVTAIACKTLKREIYQRFDNKGETVIPKGSYLCKNALYSEYVIGLLCGNLYREQCINFIDMFGFSTCPKSKYPNQPTEKGRISLLPQQYIFMDRISGTIHGTFNNNKHNDFMEMVQYNGKLHYVCDILFVQILAAIACYQNKYSLSHNDLHADNIFFEVISKDTEYKGQNLLSSSTLQYKLIRNKKSIYIPNIGYIVKIGDFGQSMKYSQPIIGNKTIMTTGYNQNDGAGPPIPNWYSPVYDVAYATNILFTLTEGKCPLIARAMGIYGHNIINPDTRFRPYISMLEDIKDLTADWMLHNDEIMRDFLTPIPGAAIVGYI